MRLIKDLNTDKLIDKYKELFTLYYFQYKAELKFWLSRYERRTLIYAGILLGSIILPLASYRIYIAKSSMVNIQPGRITFAAVSMPEEYQIYNTNQVVRIGKKHDIAMRSSGMNNSFDEDYLTAENIMYPAKNTPFYNRSLLLFNHLSFKNARIIEEESFTGVKNISISFQLDEKCRMQFPKCSAQYNFDNIILFLDKIPVSSVKMYNGLFPINNFVISGIKNRVFAEKIVEIIRGR